MKQVDDFRTIVANACKDGVYTYESLKTSSYYNDFFVAAYNLASRIVTLNKKFTTKACYFRAEDIDDVIVNLTLTIVSKYSCIVNAYLNPEQDCNGTYKPLNINSYITNIFRNMIYDFLKPYELKETKIEADAITGKNKKRTQPIEVIDETGKKHKVYISKPSLDAPIDDETDTSYAANYIVSDKIDWNPEQSLIRKETIEELTSLYNEKVQLERKRDFEIALNEIHIVSNHRYRIQTWIYVCDILKKYNERNSLNSVIKAMELSKGNAKLYDLAKEYAVKAYNTDINHFFNLCLNKNIDNDTRDYINSLIITSYKELGRDCKIDKNNVYRVRSRNNQEIINYYKSKSRR